MNEPHLETERRSNAWVLRLRSDRIIDDPTTDTVRKQLASFIAGMHPPHLVVDLSAVTLVSSAGLAFFQHVSRAVAARRGHAVICAVQPNVEALFRMVGLDTIFPIFGDVEAAVSAFD